MLTLGAKGCFWKALGWCVIKRASTAGGTGGLQGAAGPIQANAGPATAPLGEKTSKHHELELM